MGLSILNNAINKNIGPIKHAAKATWSLRVLIEKCSSVIQLMRKPIKKPKSTPIEVTTGWR